MNWFANLFSSGAAKVVDSLGTAIDKLVTSDEEKLKMKAIIEKEMYAFEKSQLDAAAAYEKELSARHRADMKSDSWLSKNVRPLTLAFMTVTTMGLAYSTIFILDKEDVVLVEPWLTLLTVLLVTIYAFYFGGRTAEKYRGIKNDQKGEK